MSSPWFEILPNELQAVLSRRPDVTAADIVECEYWHERDRFRYAIRLRIRKPRPNLVAAMYASSDEYEHKIVFVDEADIGRYHNR